MPDQRALRGQRQEHVHVIMKDGAYQHLTPSALDVLLEKNYVMKFRRSSGWVTVGIDPVRVKDRRQLTCLINNPDRRSTN